MTQQAVLKDLETRMQAATDALTREFASVRTGRANASLLDGVRVEAYGNLTPINQLATVSVPDPRTIVIQPWDASQMKEIEKGIAKSDLGLSPSNDGKVIRLTVPTLTEERRKQLAKTVGKFAEDARVAIRTARRDANDKLKALAKDKKVSEDEERRARKIAVTIERLLSGEVRLAEVVLTKRKPKPKLSAFTVAPQVVIDNTLSDALTVIEINGLDRPGLLYDVTREISDLNLDIASAHIATFGEKAVDVFYVTDLTGKKITSKSRETAIRERLMKALQARPEPALLPA